MGPGESCWGGEGGYHDGRKEGSWKAFQFNLLWCRDEADRGVVGGVEKGAYMFVEVGGSLFV